METRGLGMPSASRRLIPCSAAATLMTKMVSSRCAARQECCQVVHGVRNRVTGQS